MIQNSLHKILVLFLLISVSFEAQNSIGDYKAIWENSKIHDSVRFKAINEFYEKNTFSQPDYTIELTDFHLKLAQKSNNKEEVVKAFSERSLAYYIKGSNKVAEENLKNAIKIQTTLKNKTQLAKLYTNLASIYKLQSKFVETIKYYNYSLKIFEENKDEKAEAAVLGNLGLVFFDLKNNEIAFDYFQKAREKYKKLNLLDNVGYISLYIGAVDFEKKDYSQSIENAEKALTIFEANKDLLASIDAYILLAKSFEKLKKIQQALSSLNKSLAISQQLENNSKIVETKIFIAELFLESDVEKAAQIGEEVLAIITPNSNKKSKARLYNLLYKCYKKTKKTELSFTMYERYIIYNDSLVKEQSNLELIKEAVNQEFKIKLSNTKQSFEQSEKDLKRSQLIKLSLIILLFVVFFILIFFYLKKKNSINRKKRDELIEEIEKLKKSALTINPGVADNFELNRINIENAINRKLNETDWSVLNVLFQNPVISNKEIAAQVFLSVDGIGSSLRRMYDYFEIEESKYKKTDLIRKAIQWSNNS